MDKAKKVVIIDDFQKCPLNIKGRDKLISTLFGIFEIVVIVGNEQLRFNEIFVSGEKNVLYSDFIECEILGFGHVKRSDLIKKWYSMGGNETLLTEHELIHSRIQSERIVTSLLGNNLIPPFPFFILAIVQQLETGTPISAKSGSFGYLYEALLTLALSKIEKKGIELDIIYNYLSRLANYFYSERISQITEDRLKVWHSQYCEKQKLTLDFEVIINELIKVSVLQRDSYGFSFRYPYIYFYFVGRYLSEHIHEKGVKEKIEWMSERLHQTEAANIIIFLCYLSKDPFILSTLLSTSNDLFCGYQEFNIAQDSRNIGDMFLDIPSMVLESENTENNHTNELANIDEVESKSDEDFEDNSVSEHELEEKLDRDLQEFLQINVAIKTVQILGQLLRNFPGTWDGDQKQEIVKKCYDLGLRVLSFMYKSIEDNREGISEHVAEILTRQYPKWEKYRIYDGIRNYIFTLLESISFVFIKHVSDSVGHDRFSMTFNELLSTSPDNISYEYIDLSIHLDYYKDFPKSQILNLAKRVHRNNFAYFLLRHLVWYYFYIFQAEIQLKQSICTLLDIKISPQFGKGEKFKLPSPK